MCFVPSHFTGKERDTESGNDYFGARYYASSMGRFLSPDWSAKAEPVPYAKLDNPQTLTLYGYMQNNPLGGVDQDGHCSGDGCDKVTVTAEIQRQPGPIRTGSYRNEQNAQADARVDYKVESGGKPLTHTLIKEEVSNVTTKNGETLDAIDTRTHDSPTNSHGVVGDISALRAETKTDSITAPGPDSPAAQELSTNAYTKSTTQNLLIPSPTGGTCSVTETRTLSNLDANGQASAQYKLTLTSPRTQTAVPVNSPRQ